MKLSASTRLVLCGAVLIIAFLSQVFLSHAWFSVAIEGRTFRSSLLLDFLGCIPFLWPFIATGIVLGSRSVHPHGDLICVAGLGVLGGLLYSRLVTLLVTPPDSVFHHPQFLVRYAFPLAVSCAAYFITRWLRVLLLLRGVFPRHHASKTNERYEY